MTTTTQTEIRDALQRMVKLFNHTGLYGMIADAAQNEPQLGWTMDDMWERVEACRAAKAALAKEAAQ